VKAITVVERGLTKLETAVCPDMSRAVTAIVGAIIGLAAISFGFREHFGTWYIDGVWGYAGAAITGALVALVVRAAVSKEFGWP
jgi:hypothetical protein